MNWEHSVLNKIYKTTDFKITTTNINAIKNKTNYIAKQEQNIEKYDLASIGLNVNSIGALYIRKGDKNTIYFDYNTNYYFLLYNNFFEIEDKYVNFDDYEYQGLLIEITENGDCDKKLKIIDGKVYCNFFKTYLLKLLFIREINDEEFLSAIREINNYLSFRTFLVGNNISLYDVILLSILQNWKNWKNINQYLKGENFCHINRYISFVEKYLEIDYIKIDKYKESKWKENLGDTYKLNSNQELVKIVLENSSNLEKTDYFNEIIKFLNSGECVNSRELEDFKTLTHIACSKGNINLVKLLIDYGSDLEALDFEFMTPIYDAIYSRNLDLCEFLIEEMKININHREIQERTPFYWASCTGNIEMVDFLISKPGVDINATSKMGRSPISKACWNGRVDIVERLCKEKNILINQPDKNGRYPLHNAVWGENGGRLGKKVSGVSTADSPESVLLLIKNHHILEVQDNEGYTPLMIASSTNGVKSLEILLDHGSDPNHLNKLKASALIEATRYGNVETVKLLLYKAKNINIEVRDVDNFNAIEYSVIYKRDDCLIALLDYKEYNKLLNEVDLFDLLTLSIKTGSEKCFKIIIDYVNKMALFMGSNEINSIDFKPSNYLYFFHIMVERILNLSLYSFFNILYEEYYHILEYIFFKNSDLLVKALILKTEIEVDKFERFEENISSEKKIETTQKDIFNNKIIILEEDEELKDDKVNEEEIKNKFKQQIQHFYELYVSNISERKTISHMLLNIIIYLNDDRHFIELVQHLYKNDIDLIDDKILINEENYSYIKLCKKKINHKNNYLKVWDPLIKELIYHNILSMSLTKQHQEVFFNTLIIIPIVHKFIFTKFSDNKNILHWLFQQNNLEKLNIILQITEKHHKNRIHEVVEMVEEPDMNLLTPLDIIMKNKLFDMVEKYTKVLNDFREKHESDMCQKFKSSGIVYKVYDFEIFQGPLIALEPEYKNFIDNRLKLASTLLKKVNKQNEDDNYNFKLFQYNFFLNDTKLADLKIDEIIIKIRQNNLYNDFRLGNEKYIHEWISNEEQLIKCAEHLNKFSFIGVDLEFHGKDSEKDGIVCVLQISTLEKSFAIDTLHLRKEITTYLKEIFENDNIIKIFHGCDNDLVWLVTNFEIFTKNIFDTGRAFLVFQKYILNKAFKSTNLPSLNYLSKLFMNLKIDKSYQKSDWRIRPLTASKLFF